MVGGFMRKGLSGGERKRTSIGYELITDPSLLVLDEPTSGLDSHTSLNIIQLLRHEAYRGMTVICTIHQPSSEIFCLFDRAIFLSDGYTIYNGAPEMSAVYMQQFGLKELKHTNPADKMSIIAAEPRSILNPYVTIEELYNKCRQLLRNNLTLQIDEKSLAASTLSRRFTLIEETRKVGTLRQIALLFQRNMTQSCRNPLQLIAIVLLGCIQSFIFVSVFYGVGSDTINLTGSETTIMNWLGLVFLTSSDQFIICGFSMILLIPMAFPVFKREMGSRMYSATSYFIAATLSNICTYLYYPLLMSTLCFWFFEMPDNSFWAYILWLFCMTSGALAGIFFGQVIGSFVHTEYAAITWLLQTLTIYYLGAGIMVNAATGSNWFGDFLQYISPLRYLTEIALRRMLSGRPEVVQTSVLEELGFTWGSTLCYSLLYFYMFYCFLLGWFLMWYLSKGS